MSILAHLEWRYGVKGWPAVRDRQQAERKLQRQRKALKAQQEAFARSGPRLVRRER